MLFVEEVVELDVPVIFSGAADPLAVADDQIAELAMRIELIEKAIGIARPRDELVFHLTAGLGGEILGELHQSIRRVPCRPAQRELLALGCSFAAAHHRQRGGPKDRRRHCTT